VAEHIGPARATAAALLRTVGRYDRAGYRYVAALSTPLLDQPLRRVSHAADYSAPWFLVAGCLALLGGPPGRRAAVTGVSAVGAASFVVNQPFKLAGARRRPDRDSLGVPELRRVPMPRSASFPSGHSASAAAFAVAVGDVLPVLRVPLRLAAATVAFSRVFTGVHYPSDVMIGATVGAVTGRLASGLARSERLSARCRQAGP
jgi:undecaprenyl-diphosphatase